MGMQAFNPRPGTSLKLAEHGLELIRIKAEFAVEVAGADVLVGMALNARGEAKHEAYRPPSFRNNRLQAIQVVLVVRNHHHVVAIGQLKLFDRLVIAMQHHPFSRHAAVERRHQFTRRDGIKPQTLRRHKSRQSH